MSLLKANRKERSVFHSFILSYLAILIVCIIVSGIAYTKSLNVVESEINKSNAAMLKQVQITMDSHMQDIYSLINTIAITPKVINFAGRERPFNDSDMYELFEISRESRIYKFGNSFIESVYIYYMGSDLVVSSDGNYTVRLLYDSNHLGSESSYDDFLNVLNRRHTNHIFTIPKSSTNKDEKIIVYAQTLPLADTMKPKANILISLNEAKFQEVIKNIKLENVENVLVLDSDNTIVGSAQKILNPEQLSFDSLNKTSGIAHQVIDGEKFVVSYIHSQVSGWKYISMIPSSTFEEKVSDVRWFIVVSIAICLLLGGLLSYYFSIRNYNPINDLVLSFAAKAGRGNYKKGYNEFKFINESFLSTYEEKEIVQKRLSQNRDVLRSSLLVKLLKGRTENKVYFEDTLSYLNIKFTSDLFAVILFNFSDHGEFVNADGDSQGEEELKLIQFVLTNVVEELAGQNHQGFVTEVDNIMACIVNLNETDNQSLIKELIRISNEAQQFLHQQFNITMTIAVSNVHKMLGGISQAFLEALEALEYKVVMGSNAVIQYESIKNTVSNSGSYSYSLETEQKLINFVKASDYESAEALLNEVFNNNLNNGAISIGMIKCLMVDLVCTLTKTMDEIGGTTDKAFFDKLNPMEQLLKYETVDDMKTLMLNTLKSFCCYIEEKKKNNNVKLKQELIAFLNENYTNAEMNIEMIADHFDMNPVYISRYFKEHMGESMLDYINKLRLDRAKQLIWDDKENISDIAFKSGFYNHGTFIRIFKKYEGVTPTKYKEMSKMKT